MKKTLLTILSILIALICNAQTTKVLITTDSGNILVALYDNTPKHRDNFIKLANEHFFDSTLFHRIIPSFVIQGGDPDSKHAKPGQALGEGEYGSRVPAEINDSDFHKRGALGMARDNNPDKASSGCQFYIVVGKKWSDPDLVKMEVRTARKLLPYQKEAYETIGGTPHLDGGYTVFGEVLEGMDVVDKIAKMPRNKMDRPDTDIKMIKVRVMQPKKKKRFLGIF
ncbi:MAG: peptidylprolyl isomerase [Taibaiella sp.]|nr:peptidylprolyl isomerase [Taibaiella sp.]